MDPVKALAARGGAARWGSLRTLGVTRYALGLATTAGEIRLVGRGAYALPDAPWPVVTAAVQASAVGCVSGADVHGLWIWK
jgi:hypothetical protein